MNQIIWSWERYCAAYPALSGSSCAAPKPLLNQGFQNFLIRLCVLPYQGFPFLSSLLVGSYLPVTTGRPCGVSLAYRLFRVKRGAPGVRNPVSATERNQDSPGARWPVVVPARARTSLGSCSLTLSPGVRAVKPRSARPPPAAPRCGPLTPEGGRVTGLCPRGAQPGGLYSVFRAGVTLPHRFAFPQPVPSWVPPQTNGFGACDALGS